MDDLEAFFLQSILSLFRQAERNLHSDKLNVLEYFERRLDDQTYFLDLAHEEVNGLNDQFQNSLCNTQRNFASLMRFSCPVEQSTEPGRPRFYMPEEVVRGLQDVHGVW